MLGSRKHAKGLQMSSNDFVIRVQGLSKYYQIYDVPKERLKQMLVPRLQRMIGIQPKQYFREFKAVNDVSFEIKKGETVGIIGRNGSGKSTLLQMICGTLNPTSGGVQTNGRIAALLELGSGFNPEFTGRENVYMNAAVLGLTREETDAKFDRIVAFADIGDFIEQPVKIYSSGMMVRLAFAVLAHVDAGILVIDEALAVGDAVFTQKCMSYIRDFQKRGTLLFVSHDLGSVQNLCETAIWLDHGVARMIGSAKDVAEAYLEYTLQESYGSSAKLNSVNVTNINKVLEVDVAPQNSVPVPVQMDYQSEVSVQDNISEAKGWKTGAADLISIQLARLDGSDDEALSGGESVCVTIKSKANQELANPILGFTVRDRLGQELFGENTLPFTDLNPLPVQSGQEFCAEFYFNLPMLPNGEYAVMASVANGTLYDHIQHHFLHDALILTVTSSKIRWGLVGISFEHVTLKILNEHQQNT
jgi:lipopolysaccharide transport system ATP-binding protein